MVRSSGAIIHEWVKGFQDFIHDLGQLSFITYRRTVAKMYQKIQYDDFRLQVLEKACTENEESTYAHQQELMLN